MARGSKTSSLLAKYSLMYEKKPRSRVFAPLAETYRKIGMLDEALKILKEGIRNHPSYTLGYVVLGNCYFDLQNYEMAYNTIRPFVSQNLENITLQKLFAKTCINLGHLEEALQTFKYLLLLNPKDQNVADQIKLLEDDLLVSSEEDEIPSEYTAQEDSDSFNEDDWVQVSFSDSESKSAETKSTDLDEWSVKKNPLEDFKSEIGSKEIKLTERSLDDQYFHEEFDNEADDVVVDEDVKENSDEMPIITHTLVDLYCTQGHFDRAILILESILELHPNDKATQLKLEEIKGLSVEANHIISEITEKNEKLKDVASPDKTEVSSDKTNLVEKKIQKLEKLYHLYYQKLETKSQQVLS